MFKLDLEKAEEPEIKLPSSIGSQKKHKIPNKHLLLLHDYAKAFDCVQFSSAAQSCPTLCDPMDCSMLGFLVHHQLLELTQTHVHQVGDAIQPSHLLLSPSPTFNLSQIRVFSNESVLRTRWPKYQSFSFSISPSNEYSGLISFRIDWFDLLTVQGTLKNILQHHSSKASILWCSASFMIHLSHTHVTIMLSEISNHKSTNTVQFCLCEVHSIVRFIETGSRMEAARESGEG